MQNPSLNPDGGNVECVPVGNRVPGPYQADGYPVAQPAGYQPAQADGYAPAQPGGCSVTTPEIYPGSQPSGYHNQNRSYQPQGRWMVPAVNLPTGGYIGTPGVQYVGQCQVPLAIGPRPALSAQGGGGGLAIVQTTAADEWLTRRNYLPKKHIIALGILQILCGVAAMILNGVGIRVGAFLNTAGYGIWCGYMAIAAGALGVEAGIRQKEEHLSCGMVMSVIAAVFVSIQLSIAIISFRKDNACLQLEQGADFDYDGRFATAYTISQLNSAVAVDVLLMLFGFTELVASIWFFAIGCRFLRCTCCHAGCCTCCKAIDQQTRMDVRTCQSSNQQVVFQNGQRVAPQGAGNAMLQPHPTGVVGGQAVMSPPPYSTLTSESYPTGTADGQAVMSPLPCTALTSESYPTGAVGEQSVMSSPPYPALTSESYPTSAADGQAVMSPPPYTALTSESYPTSAVGEQAVMSPPPYHTLTSESYPRGAAGGPAVMSPPPYHTLTSESYPTGAAGGPAVMSPPRYTVLTSESYPTGAVGGQAMMSPPPYPALTSESNPTSAASGQAVMSPPLDTTLTSESYPTDDAGGQAVLSLPPYTALTSESYLMGAVGGQAVMSPSLYAASTSESGENAMSEPPIETKANDDNVNAALDYEQV